MKKSLPILNAKGIRCAEKDYIPQQVSNIKGITRVPHGTQTFVTKFPSMTSFLDYIDNNDTVDGVLSIIQGYASSGELHSHKSDYRTQEWTMTNNYSAAIKLAKEGWKEGAVEVKSKLDVLIPRFTKEATRSKLDVSGANVSVPAYLNGNPRQMWNRKKVMKKAKVLDVNKVIDIPWFNSPEKLIEWNTNALAVVYALEKAGYACNINIVAGHAHSETQEIVYIRVKNANERLNIMKLAFPMCHPSMLRRLVFRYNEVTDTNQYSIPGKLDSFYGHAVNDEVYEAMLQMDENKEIYIPSVFPEYKIQEVLDRQLQLFNKK